MVISKELFIGLAISIPIGLIIMISAWIWMKLKTKKIKNEYSKQNTQILKDTKPRKNFGKLLWELKSKTTNPLEDEQIEFILNTIWINKYKTFKLVKPINNYLEESLVKLAEIEKVEENADITIIDNSENLSELFDKEFKFVKSKKMIVITNANRKLKLIKNLIIYLKTINAKYEWQNYGNGIILVVK